MPSRIPGVCVCGFRILSMDSQANMGVFQSAPIAASGFGGVVCASLESLLVEVELLLETVEAVCKSGIPNEPYMMNFRTIMLTPTQLTFRMKISLASSPTRSTRSSRLPSGPFAWLESRGMNTQLEARVSAATINYCRPSAWQTPILHTLFK